MKTKETKSKQLNLTLTPTLFSQFRQILYMQQVSANSLVNTWIQQYVDEHTDLLEAYRKTFPIN